MGNFLCEEVCDRVGFWETQCCKAECPACFYLAFKKRYDYYHHLPALKLIMFLQDYADEIVHFYTWHVNYVGIPEMQFLSTASSTELVSEYPDIWRQDKLPKGLAKDRGRGGGVITKALQPLRNSCLFIFFQAQY